MENIHDIEKQNKIKLNLLSEICLFERRGVMQISNVNFDSSIEEIMFTHEIMYNKLQNMKYEYKMKQILELSKIGLDIINDNKTNSKSDK